MATATADGDTDTGTDSLLFRLTVFVGLVSVLGGVTMVASPGLASALPFLNLMTVGLAAVIALVMGVWLVRVRMASEIEQTRIVDPETPLKSPSPGNDVDRMIYEMIHHRHGTLESREQIRERLGEVATQVIVHQDDCTRAEALKQIQQGTWTDNDVAAAFFTDEHVNVDASTSLFGDLLGGGGDHPYKVRVQHVVDAIAERAGMRDRFQVEEEEEKSLLDQLLGAADDDEDDEFVEWADLAELNIEEEGERVAEDVWYRSTIYTGHWTGVSAFALVALGIGFLVQSPPLLLGSAVAGAFAGYARFGSAPAMTNLEVSRSLSNYEPAPGEEVDVVVTVENAGDSFLSDLRVIDRVPSRIRVVEGCPRIGTALRPGEEARFQYTIVAERGAHEWPTQVIGRDLAGSVERDAVIEVEGEMTCYPRLQTTTEMPVRSQTTVFAGQVNTDIGGSGLEFHSVREFQKGDPMKRVNWKKYARTGELATIDFRQEKAATVVLLFDTRQSAYVSASPESPHAVDRSVEAANDVFAALDDRGDLVGVAAFDTVPCWLAPGAGDGHVERARRLFATHPALSSYPPEVSDIESQYVDPMVHVRRQLPSNTQLFMFSPLADDYAAEVARRLDGSGHLVTIISPDPTAGETVGERLASIEREMRVNRLREHGIRVVDWAEANPLRLELERAEQRW